MEKMTYNIKSSEWDYKVTIKVEQGKSIEYYQDSNLILKLTKQEDGKVNFEFYDTCEGEWDSGVCSNSFEKIFATIVTYPFDFQVYSL